MHESLSVKRNNEINKHGIEGKKKQGKKRIKEQELLNMLKLKYLGLDSSTS